jgi:arabinofuranosyltransferase
MIDTRQYAYREGAGLLSWKRGRHLPDHAWYHHGLRMRASPERVFVGVFGGEPIGYAGFAAGPDKFIIDVVALGDPLLSRLPAIVPPTRDEWKSGHFHRNLPAGYVESITYDGNLIEDPAIHALYADIRLATRARLWSRPRFAAILRLNLDAY